CATPATCSSPTATSGYQQLRNEEVAFHRTRSIMQPSHCILEPTAMTTATTAQTDRIERSIQIDAPRSRVWRALSNAEEFGNWFGANLKGQAFAPGRRVQGAITISGYEHVMFDV